MTVTLLCKCLYTSVDTCEKICCFKSDKAICRTTHVCACVGMPLSVHLNWPWSRLIFVLALPSFRVEIDMQQRDGEDNRFSPLSRSARDDSWLFPVLVIQMKSLNRTREPLSPSNQCATHVECDLSVWNSARIVFCLFSFQQWSDSNLESSISAYAHEASTIFIYEPLVRVSVCLFVWQISLDVD